MIPSIKAIKNRNTVRPVRTINSLDHYTDSIANEIIRYHRTYPQYEPSPLISLKSMTERLGVKSVLVKDESPRFGLKAFKVLGGTHAIGRLIAKMMQVDFRDISYDYLKSDEIRKKLGEMTLCTASDGNHGRGVAWTASAIGHKAVIFLPKGTVRARIEAIEQTGATAVVTDKHYDDTVLLARQTAEQNGWHFIQDTSFADYKKNPLWIMQGYLTLAKEIIDQLNECNIERPTHVFLQAGVGSMAAAVLAYLINIYGDNYPQTIIMEPRQAACFYDSIEQGTPISAKGNLDTIMAGLSCGVPSPIAWEIIHSYADWFVSCDDDLSRKGMRAYAEPSGDDPKIISGESGAVGLGLLIELMTNPEYESLSCDLGIDKNSVVLLINTEGDTDPENYEKIVSNS